MTLSPSIIKKLKNAYGLKQYASNATPGNDTEWLRTAKSKTYSASTLVDSNHSIYPFVIAGILTYFNMSGDDITIAIDHLNSALPEFVDNKAIDSSLMLFVEHPENPVPPVDLKSFYLPGRENKMRFTKKKADNKATFGTCDFVGLDGENLVEPDKSLKKGDLVIVDFVLQVYSSNRDGTVTNGTRLVPVSIQQLQKELVVFDDESKPISVPTPPPKRRKY